MKFYGGKAESMSILVHVRDKTMDEEVDKIIKCDNFSRFLKKVTRTNAYAYTHSAEYSNALDYI